MFFIFKMDEEQEELEENEALYELTDIEVNTVGLVRSGANMEKFFLLKSDDLEAYMADELDVVIEEVIEETISEVTEPPAPLTDPAPAPDEDGFFDRFRGKLEEWGVVKARASKDALVMAAKTLGVTPEEMNKMYKQFMAGGKPPMMGGEEEEEPMPKKKTEKSADPVDIQKAVSEAVSSVKAELEKAYKDQVTGLEAKVESLSKEAAEQRDLREGREFLEKAMEFKAFPTSYTDLAGMLRNLSKALEPEEFQKWETLLKAADKNLFTAGLFSEMGTAELSKEEVSLVEKAERIQKEKNISYAEALLELDPVEQQRLVNETRSRAGGKR